MFVSLIYVYVTAFREGHVGGCKVMNEPRVNLRKIRSICCQRCVLNRLGLNTARVTALWRAEAICWIKSCRF